MAALTDDDHDVVRTALKVLADSGQLVQSDLGPLLARSDPAVRRTSIYYLEKTDATAVPARLFSDPDQSVARQAVLTAGNLKDQQSTPHLLRLLGTSDDPDLRALIIRILGRLGDATAFATLIEATSADDDFTRLEAARALGALRDPRARPALERLLGDATYPERHDANGFPRVRSGWSIAKVAGDSVRPLDP